LLYVTTRNSCDTFTSARASLEKRGEDGGLYLPHKLIPFSWEDIESLSKKAFNQCTAEIINHFFQTRLSGWDIDFAVGKMPIRMEAMNQRIVVCENWHNVSWQFSGMVDQICKLIFPDRMPSKGYGPWMEIGVRIAVLFGAVGELIQQGIADRNHKIDVSTVCGDFYCPLSIWCAREMGLPIENIICCCNENSSVWDLFTHGQLRTDTVAVSTDLPDADISLPDGLEALLYLCCGAKEVEKYVEVCRRGGTYFPDPAVLDRLRQGIHVRVISTDRTMRTIPNVFGTHRYILSPYSALAYAGLLDYRAGTGESRYGLIMADNSVFRDSRIVCSALGISEQELYELLRLR